MSEILSNENCTAGVVIKPVATTVRMKIKHKSNAATEIIRVVANSHNIW